MPALPLFDEPFLRDQLGAEFRDFEESPEAAALLQPGATLTVENTGTPLRDRKACLYPFQTMMNLRIDWE